MRYLHSESESKEIGVSLHRISQSFHGVYWQFSGLLTSQSERERETGDADGHLHDFLVDGFHDGGAEEGAVPVVHLPDRVGEGRSG